MGLVQYDGTSNQSIVEGPTELEPRVRTQSQEYSRFWLTLTHCICISCFGLPAFKIEILILKEQRYW